MRRVEKTGICIILLTVLAVAAGCGGAPASTGPSPSPSAATPSPEPTPTPTEAPLGTVVDGWVAGMPDYVPRFACGTLDIGASKAVEQSRSTIFSLRFTGVGQADVDAYAEALRGKGYAVAADMIGDTYTLTASLEFGWGRVALVLTLKDGAAAYVLEAPV